MPAAVLCGAQRILTALIDRAIPQRFKVGSRPQPAGHGVGQLGLAELEPENGPR